GVSGHRSGAGGCSGAVAPGLPKIILVGLPDKAVNESGERVRAALIASCLGLPPKRIVVNLAPADLLKEGSHYDLPIALGIMAAIGAIPRTRSMVTSPWANSVSTGASLMSVASCPQPLPPSRAILALSAPHHRALKRP